jgi:hypothetical protein
VIRKCTAACCRPGAVLGVSPLITVETYYNVHAVNVNRVVHAMNISIVLKNRDNFRTHSPKLPQFG